MKHFIRFIAFSFFLFNCNLIQCQNEWFNLKSTDFIIGLDDKKYLRNKLTESHLLVVDKGSIEGTIAGTYENWNWNVTLTVHLITIPEKNYSRIEVLVNVANAGISERLLSEITVLFPNKKIDEIKDIAILNEELFNNTQRYIHLYSRDDDNVIATVSYSEKQYYFTFEKKGAN